ncbi:MAG: DNA polymerase III subunit beta, partial [Demequinaceae bacterium]|nr:DNA polymerase III subunit beta [Demequinaceae bacterium]
GEITVAFNPHYLLDGLTAMMTEYVRLGFTQETKPVEFMGVEKLGGSASSQFRYLLVPIRISS